MLKKFDNISFNFFLLSLLLFSIPSFYLLPFLRNAFLTTQGFARILIVCIFIFKLIEGVIKEKKLITDENKKIIALIMLFFLVQSLGIFVSLNVFSFLGIYKDAIIGLLFFFICFWYKEKHVKIIYALLIASFINVLFQSLLIVFEESFLNVLHPFIYQRYFDILEADFFRGRTYMSSYDEIVLPFLFLPFWERINYGKPFSYFLLIGVSFFSILSNFRTRALMTLFSIISSLLIFNKNVKKNLVIYLLMFIGIAYLANFTASKTIGYSIYDRFFSNQELNKDGALITRQNQILDALEMGSNFLGIGLGNYYDNIETSRKTNTSSLEGNVLKKEVNLGIHNNFATVLAESGYIGLIIFILIMFEFAKRDFSLIRKNQNEYKKAFIISFWTLFIYGLFNPPVPASYQVLFWGIRGLLL